MIEKVRTATLHAPANAQITGNGAACDIGESHEINIVAEIFKGDNADFVLTPQVNDAAGGGTWVGLPAGTSMKIYAAAATAASDDLVRGADGATFSTTTFSGAAAAGIHRVLMKIDPATLGLHATTGDPITQFRVVVTPGHANDRGSVTAYLTPLRYKP